MPVMRRLVQLACKRWWRGSVNVTGGYAVVIDALEPLVRQSRTTCIPPAACFLRPLRWSS